MNRIILLSVPSLVGLLLQNSPSVSIFWSLAGSLFIAAIAQTEWFRQSGDSVPVTQRLLRPASIYHLFFLGFHVLGGAFRGLDASGFVLWERAAISWEDELERLVVVQQLMLLAHASVTAGMKMASFRYDRPRYLIPSIPPFGLIMLSVVSVSLGTVARWVPGLWNISFKFIDIASAAIVLEVARSVYRKHFINLVLTLAILAFTLLQQVKSGWRGLVLWTAIPLGAMLYPLMPKRIVLGGIAFVLFFLMYIVPFGTAMRQLVWYEDVGRDIGAAIALESALSMSVGERLDVAWSMMVNRANEAYQFGRYIEYVPTVRPYYGLDLVGEAFMGFVPRVMWPGKPDLEAVAMQRVYDAGIILEGSTTSVKSNFYQDAYLSGGPVAIVIACVMYGILSMVISRACERWFGGYEIGTCLIYTSLFGAAFNFAHNFLFFVGAVWGSFLTLWAVFYFAKFMGWIIPSRTAHQLPKGQLSLKEPLPISPGVPSINKGTRS